MAVIASENKNFCRCGCGEEIPFISKMGKPQRFKYGHYDRTLSGPIRYNWKGGRKKHSDGYVYVLHADHIRAVGNEGYVLEHILVYEEFHKCCLLPWSRVHHINEIRDDNRIENLQAMMAGKHISHHHKGKIVTDHSNTICVVCGSNKTYMRHGKHGNYPEWHPIYRELDIWQCKTCHQRVRRAQGSP